MTIEPYPCPRCKGDGAEPGRAWLVCTECYGNRFLYRNVVPSHVPPEPTDEPPGHDLKENPA